jgi:hypothetical protein
LARFLPRVKAVAEARILPVPRINRSRRRSCSSHSRVKVSVTKLRDNKVNPAAGWCLGHRQITQKGFLGRREATTRSSKTFKIVSKPTTFVDQTLSQRLSGARMQAWRLSNLWIQRFQPLPERSRRALLAEVIAAGLPETPTTVSHQLLSASMLLNSSRSSSSHSSSSSSSSSSRGRFQQEQMAAKRH